MVLNPAINFVPNLHMDSKSTVVQWYTVTLFTLIIILQFLWSHNLQRLDNLAPIQFGGVILWGKQLLPDCGTYRDLEHLVGTLTCTQALPAWAQKQQNNRATYGRNNMPEKYASNDLFQSFLFKIGHFWFFHFLKNRHDAFIMQKYDFLYNIFYIPKFTILTKFTDLLRVISAWIFMNKALVQNPERRLSHFFSLLSTSTLCILHVSISKLTVFMKWTSTPRSHVKNMIKTSTLDFIFSSHKTSSPWYSWLGRSINKHKI